MAKESFFFSFFSSLLLLLFFLPWKVHLSDFEILTNDFTQFSIQTLNLNFTPLSSSFHFSISAFSPTTKHYPFTMFNMGNISCSEVPSHHHHHLETSILIFLHSLSFSSAFSQIINDLSFHLLILFFHPQPLNLLLYHSSSSSYWTKIHVTSAPWLSSHPVIPVIAIVITIFLPPFASNQEKCLNRFHRIIWPL